MTPPPIDPQSDPTTTRVQDPALGRESRLHWGIPLLTLLAGVILSIVFHYLAFREVQSRFAADFLQHAKPRAEAIVQELNHQLSGLQHLALMFESSDVVNAEEFHHYTVPMVSSSKPVQAIEWITRVPSSSVSELIANARRRGQLGFRLTEKDASGALVEARPREEYFPVTYLEPLTGNESALGYDQASHPTRRAALLLARDQGQTIATEPVHLVQTHVATRGFLVFIPVYRGHEALHDTAARRARLSGFVLGVYLAERLIGEALRRLPELGLNITVDDPSIPTAERRLYSHPGVPPSPASLPVYERLIPVAGRQWRVCISPGTPFVEAVYARWHLAVFPLGLLLSVLVTLLVSQLQRLRMIDLRKRKAFQQALLNGLPFLAWLKDSEGRFLAVNEPFAEACGCALSEIEGRTDLDVWPGELAERYRTADADVMARGQKTNVEEPILKEGQPIWFETYRAPVFDASGTLLGTTGFSRDISQRKTSEQELQEAYVLLSGLIDSIPDIVFFKNREGVYLGCNPEFARFMGKTREEIVKHTAYDLFACEFADFIKEQDRLVLEEGQPRHFEEWVDCPDGRRVLLDTFKAPMSYHGGEIIGIVAISRDITIPKRNEEALRASEERLSLALSGADMGMWDWNIATGELIVDDRWAAMLGYRRDELVLHVSFWESLLHPDDSPLVTKKLESHLRGETPQYESEQRLQHKDGHWVWVLDRGKVTARAADGTPLRAAGTHLDITSRRAAEDEVRSARDAAESANRAKSDFLANMSHEIRTPLNAILGFAELLHDRGRDAREKGYLEAISVSGQNLLTTINDILDMSKIEAGLLQIEPGEVKPHALLNEVAKVFSLKATEKGLTLTVETEETLPPTVLTDEVRLRQILFNLLGNAVKFTNRGTVLIKASAVPVDDDSIDLILEVQDTGIGIPPHEQERIFAPFAQQEGQSNRTYGGTGLGLAISRRLTALLGGTLALESVEGQGSTFTVTLRRVPVVLASNATAVRTPEDARVLFAETLVVHADDQESNRVLLRAMLNESGIRLIDAVNGEEAMTLVLRERPSLVLLDLKMPVCDGIEAAQRLRADETTARLPLIAVTASVIEKPPAGLFDTVLYKPLKKSRLIQTLAGYLPVLSTSKDKGPVPEKDAHPAEERIALARLVQDQGAALWETARTGNRPRDIGRFADWLISMERTCSLAGHLGRALRGAVDEYKIDRLRALIAEVEECLGGKET